MGLISFLHTADWQIGMKARSVARVAERVRAARLDTASRLMRLAVERRVDFVVIAGDVFEDNLVGGADVHKVLRILSECAPIPVYMLPGNHDPLTPDSVYNRSAFGDSLAPNVHVFRSREPVSPAPGVVLLPAPLEAKEGFEDPTDAFAVASAAPEEGVIAIGVAHGSLRIPNKYEPGDFPIALDAPERHGLDYLALGHWHSFYAHGDRVVYPGTPEPTGFREDAGEASGTGTAALVTIEGRGAVPKVERLSTAMLQWSTVRVDLDGDQQDAPAQARRRAEAISNPDRTLLRLVLEGRSPSGDPAWLDDLGAWLEARFLHVEVDTSRLLTEAAAARLRSAAGADPFLGALISDLETAAQAVGPEDVQEALRILTALAQEVFG